MCSIHLDDSYRWRGEREIEPIKLHVPFGSGGRRTQIKYLNKSTDIYYKNITSIKVLLFQFYSSESKFFNVLKGALCNIYNDLLTEMQYNVCNYVFSV